MLLSSLSSSSVVVIVWWCVMLGQAALALHVKTPLVKAFSDGERTIWLKLDCAQPPGSFKLRGVSRVVQLAAAKGAAGVVSSSGGNAGIATAYAAQKLGLECVVVLPVTTPEATRKSLRDSYGATVVVRGRAWDEANVEALRLAAEKEWPLVHPFDDPDLWPGHASLVDECFDQLRDAGEAPPDCFVASVGGGGLLAGIMHGVSKQQASRRVAIVAVETEGADCFSRSVAQRKPATLPNITSIAKSLGALTPSTTILEAALRKDANYDVSTRVVSDTQALSAVFRFAKDYRQLVEPACGAALVACYDTALLPADVKNVVIEVCGGAVVDLPTLARHAADLFERQNIHPGGLYDS
mmetsp:Transcript_25551/g.82676  ORF Transcript_25551/g.82676 Transcript_25551/m.82676 type:complete len:354 (-) Transcript_25551:396-1457(-)